MLKFQSWFCCIIIFISFFLIPAAPQATMPISFSWAVLTDTDSGMQALDFSKPQKVKKNATLQLYLHPDKNTYVYIFLLDSNNYFTPIFPVTADYYDQYRPGDVIRIPAGQARFTIVPPAGQEKFYLLASPNRLTKIEKLQIKCISDPKDIESQAELFQHVRYLRRKHSKLSQFTEKGMPVSGTRRDLEAKRGAAGTDSFIATHVAATGFYSRILRLNHE